jgi:poly(3-hydroxybutyrate) depolymerase
MIMVPIAMPVAATPVVATTPVVVATTPVVATPALATPALATPALTAAHSGAPSEMLATAKMAATTARSSWDQWCGEHQYEKANHEKYKL